MIKSIDAIFQEEDDTEVKAKDATPEQWDAMHQRLDQRKENRRFDIEANEAIQLVRGRNYPIPMPMANANEKTSQTKTTVEQVKPLKRQLAKAIWNFIKANWLFIFIMAIIIYLCIVI